MLGGQLSLLLVLLSVSSVVVDAVGDKCTVQCGIDYFGRPQYWMSATAGLDKCAAQDLVENGNFSPLGCSANTNIFRNNDFECIADTSSSCRGWDRADAATVPVARISERYYEAKKEMEAQKSEGVADSASETADVEGRFQGVGDCFIECGIDFADRTQFWLSKTPGLTYCDVLKAFETNDWSELGCTDDVALYETIGYKCVTVNENETC